MLISNFINNNITIKVILNKHKHNAFVILLIEAFVAFDLKLSSLKFNCSEVLFVVLLGYLCRSISNEFLVKLFHAKFINLIHEKNEFLLF